MERYAVYYAPGPESSLWEFGCRWLGRDPLTGALHAAEPLSGLDPKVQAALTAAPRHYGFHATLKPPFALAPGMDVEELRAALSAFAEAQPPVTAPPLQFAELDGFLALRPEAPAPALDGLAAACVRAFDRFRAPPTPAELARRRQRELTPRQLDLLAAWGYPYVMEEFRFHLTLTGRLEVGARDALWPLLAERLAPLLGEPLCVNTLALVRQESAEHPFRIVDRFALKGDVITASEVKASPRHQPVNRGRRGAGRR